MARQASDVGPVMAELSGYVAEALGRGLPAAVAEKGRQHLLDTLGAMVSGSRLNPGRQAIAYVRGRGGTPEALVPGTDIVTSVENAALAGGMLAHADETDDSHPVAFNHPGCGVVPAALAMAERGGRSGSDLLRAVVLGYDIAARSTIALGVERFYGAHHSTHSFGSLFGAAAAAGALARLNARQVRWLFSYTAQQASGIATWARDEEHIEKAFDFGGMGARNGVAAATMVAAGFTGVDDVFSGPRNFFAAYGGTPEEMSRGLGREFEIMRANIKKWSVGSPIQAPLDSLEALMAEHRLGAADVARIEARVGLDEAHIVDDRSMPDICLQHLLAVLLLDGGLTFAATQDYARMDDAAVRAVRERIDYVHDGDLARREGSVRITTTDGRDLRHLTRHVRGTAANPMTQGEVDAKVFDLCAPILGEDRARSLNDTVWAIEGVGTVRDLRPLLQA